MSAALALLKGGGHGWVRIVAGSVAVVPGRESAGGGRLDDLSTWRNRRAIRSGRGYLRRP